ncbi:alcohol dehydrogenase [Legionella fallonii]|uniref:Alcohol dehydrogenase n=1 Tax=Legionella fallonii LLAP-10 TaxID=1212491 RepID=A0A098G7H1_9GAMM|nr:alcohol dehydrogenase [Legionella fallonii]CEG57460.1 Alcohol dehydrogenase [Legionella fallonii LLAP-10]
MKTYRAIEITTPGKLNLVERPLREPGPGQVRLRVEAAGVCHTDVMAVEGLWPGLKYPLVPGHEIAGRIDAVGAEVNHWKIGQRVGVGWFGGECRECESCRRGDFINCAKLIIPGFSMDGGYAESVIVEARSLASLPDELNAEDAAPLLCAGVTTYNALRNANLRPGDVVAIQGIGGLGHLGVQFARHMGFYTIAIARGKEKEKLALELGAEQYIDSEAQDPAEALLKLGGADAILATAANGKSMGPLLGGLKARGKLIVVGVSHEPIEISIPQLISGTKTIQGSASGTARDIEDTLNFSCQEHVHSMNEVVPFEKAPEAYEKMKKNAARFRMVLKINQ